MKFYMKFYMKFSYCVTDFSSLPLQFDCCGYNNATDWFNNTRAIEASGQQLPGCPNCTLNVDENCMQFVDPRTGREYITFDVSCRTCSYGDPLPVKAVAL